MVTVREEFLVTKAHKMVGQRKSAQITPLANPLVVEQTIIGVLTRASPFKERWARGVKRLNSLRTLNTPQTMS